MINLLPPKVKKEIFLERKKKVILVNLILLLLFFTLSLSAIFLIKFYLQEQATYLKTQIKYNKQILEKNANKKILDKIDLINRSFKKLNVFYEKKIYISKILEKISQILPDNAYLTDFSISPDSATKNENDKLSQWINFNVSIAGFSPTREEIIQLKKNIEKEESFKEVFFPLTNWVKSTDINFSLTFKIVKP